MEVLLLEKIVGALTSIDLTLTAIQEQIHAQQYEHEKMLTQLFTPILQLGMEMLGKVNQEVDKEIAKEKKNG